MGLRSTCVETSTGYAIRTVTICFLLTFFCLFCPLFSRLLAFLRCFFFLSVLALFALRLCWRSSHNGNRRCGCTQTKAEQQTIIFRICSSVFVHARAFLSFFALFFWFFFFFFSFFFLTCTQRVQVRLRGSHSLALLLLIVLLMPTLCVMPLFSESPVCFAISLWSCWSWFV